MVEFVVVAVLMLVPLVYVVTGVAAVQRTSFAASTAVREAGRAFVTADSPEQARTRARAAALLALDDHGLALPPSALHLTCLDGPCLSPGSRVQVSLALVAPPPVPVPVSATHLEVVDDYRAAP